MARRSRIKSSKIDVRYLDADLQERVVTVRNTWQLDEKLTSLYATGCKPISINGQQAYNPRNVEIAVRYLEQMGCEISRIGLFDFTVYAPWVDRPVNMTPQKLIEKSLKIREAQKNQQDQI
ncbi:MAG: hypothetical protein ACYC27_02930 [Armatimonadota bacterium]